MTFPRLLRHFVASMVLAPWLCGCGASPLQPSASTLSPEPGSASESVGSLSDVPGETLHRGDFYPLAPGNRWHYQRRFTVRILDANGAEIERSDFFSEIERVQTCVEHVNDRDYLIERFEETSQGDPFRLWVRFRQDRGGLYEADNTGPPACESGARLARADEADLHTEALSRAVSNLADVDRRAAFERASATIRVRLRSLRGTGGAVESFRHRRGRGPDRPPAGELLRLRYPLHAGQRWIIREDPRFEAKVERAEILMLAPGRMLSWRIRYTNEFLGSEDRVHVWYGPRGFLKLAYRIEGVATDESGNVLGTVIAEELEVLDDLQLMGRRLVSDAPVSGLLD